MAFRFISIALLSIVHISTSAPLNILENLEVADDTHSVGSYIREVRAARPDYHKEYENEGDGEIGYSRKKAGGGKKGYQHFDSYHKKAGDNYEFEKQDSYGQDDEGQAGAYSHQHEQKEKYRERPSDAEVEEEDTEGEDNPDHENEEIKKQGSSDGNGGVEAEGHDKADYILPEKYTYGEGDEYSF